MKRKRVAIIPIGLLVLLVAVPVVQIGRYTQAERTLLRALPTPFGGGPITPEGTDLILSVQSSAVPVLLQWSLARPGRGSESTTRLGPVCVLRRSRARLG